ncbi:polymer-forming cytoskeletal protein, partial [candidate division KSB1 bacterium]|nr:polymer-forming cytoskeletal protein [candidate division KSB1 bacterium]
IGGMVIGNITATGKVTLEANSIFKGEMRTQKLVIHDGAVFEGRCSMSEQPMDFSKPKVDELGMGNRLQNSDKMNDKRMKFSK